MQSSKLLIPITKCNLHVDIYEVFVRTFNFKILGTTFHKIDLDESHALIGSTFTFKIWNLLYGNCI